MEFEIAVILKVEAGEPTQAVVRAGQVVLDGLARGVIPAVLMSLAVVAPVPSVACVGPETPITGD